MAKTKARSRASKTHELPNDAFSQAILAWRSPEFMRYERGWLWFLVAGLIDAALITYAILSGSWTMALVFAVIPLVVLLEHKRKPKVVEVVFSQYGVKFGDIKMPYSNLKKFWIFHDPPYVDELHLLTNSRMHPEVTIPLMGVDPNLVRQLLVTQIPEWEGKKESFLDMLIRLLRLG